MTLALKKKTPTPRMYFFHVIVLTIQLPCASTLYGDSGTQTFSILQSFHCLGVLISKAKADSRHLFCC